MFKLLIALLVAMASAVPPQFPESWGEQPMVQTMDYRPLPGGYGHGSSTLSAWILEQMAKEREKTGHGARPARGMFSFSRGAGTILASRPLGRALVNFSRWPTLHTRPLLSPPPHPSFVPSLAVSYPPAFGEPPRMQTRDLRPLPFGYGMGSGTLATWLSRKAEEVYQETVDEYSGFE